MGIEIKELLKEGDGNCDVTLQTMPTSHKVQPYLHTSTHAMIHALAYANDGTELLYPGGAAVKCTVYQN